MSNTYISPNKACQFTDSKKYTCEKMKIMEQDKAFDRCVNFLTCMIEKYGQELINEIATEDNTEINNKLENKKSA